jgi:tRNA threonylcarbamoyladenosine biosynthesis protein TsaB
VILLALDTSTETASVALLREGRVEQRVEEGGRSHGERLLPMVDELLAQAGLRLSDLDAIAFGRGPGGFTGVRLCASVVQGLAFGAGLPVVPVSTLRAVAQVALERDTGAQRVLACNDARMGEVYWAWFERGGDGLARASSPEHVSAPEQVAIDAAGSMAVSGAGRGFAAYPGLATSSPGLARILADAWPSAAAIARLAAPEVTAGAVLPATAALPVYVRDRVAQPKGG